MDEKNEIEMGEMEHKSTQMNEYPRDLLERFAVGNHYPAELAETTDDTEEIELNLGLSLGGRFGVDPKESKLVRSSSIAVLKTVLRDDDAMAPPPVVYHALIKASSLPTENEEEWRKRKELQSLRRMEAKRKRSEKQRNFRASKDRATLEGSGEEEKLAAAEGLVATNSKGKVDSSTVLPGFTGASPKQQQFMVSNGLSSSMVLPLGVPAWAASARGATLARGMDASPKGKANVLAPPPLPGLPPSLSLSQGSLGSQGSSLSGISDFENRPFQGSSNCTEARSPMSVQSKPEQSEQKPCCNVPGTNSIEKSGMSSKIKLENQAKKPNKVVDKDEVRGSGMNVVEDMPCVSTKGDGPNGRRIEGLLYKYKNGEEVRIVCVCHGNFLSPAEFVKHAGGGDVAHPMRHIVVNPSPSFI